jgi:fido (protein-threonine AMPylation protein)
VHPEEVEGTLRAGWAVTDTLDDPFHRAVMMAFVVAEVHPFDDGNGRISRIMMNAELSAGGQCRIVIPSVYRHDYLGALGALTHNARPDALVSVLAFAQRWTSQVDWSDRLHADADLESTNAFVDSGRAVLSGTKLMLPAAVPAHQLIAPPAQGPSRSGS